MISSIAAQQAKYKQLLVDWLVGFALLFMMHYIMSGIVSLNTMVVKILKNDEGDSHYVGLAELNDNPFVNPLEIDWNNPFWSYMDNFGRNNRALFNWPSDWIQSHLGLRPESKWYRIATGWEEEDFVNERYQKFLSENLLVRNSSYEKGTFSSDGEEGVDHVEPSGRLDLNSVGPGHEAINGLGYISGDLRRTTWGDDGVIYLSASIFNSKGGNEKYRNKAIIKLNTMSYVRTISSFSLNEEDNVILYDNGGPKMTSNITAMGFSILYLALVIETIMFAFTYLKRVLQMSFLTMIAPIVAIMYPVDKIGDGKAQAFNTWFKDYLFNVLIQPMHLLLYTIFIVAAHELTSRNIIYAIAVYGFMIPSEKYFKKILGFEKGGSNAGGGPMSQALGRSLAMDGLGKLTGIGPAGRHGGSGKSGDSGKIRKVGKNKASATDSNGNINPLGGGAPGTGGGASGTGTRRFGGSRRTGGGSNGNGRINPLTGNRVNRLKNGIKSTLGAVGNAGKRRIVRAATGGRFSSLSTPGAVGAMIGNTGRHVLRGGARIAGTIGVGSIGLMAGAATAITTGDIGNTWKGTIMGVAAGNKIASNTFDRIDDAGSAFAEEVKAERAANDEEYNKKYQTQQVFELLDEDLAACSKKDRDEYIKIIQQYADVTNLDSIDKVEALDKIRNEYGSTEAPARTKLIDDAQKRENEAEQRRAKAEQSRNRARNADERRKAEEAMRKAEADRNRAQADRNSYTTMQSLGANQETGTNALTYAKRYKNVFTDPDKVLKSLMNDEGYNELQAMQMLELIKAANKKLK